MTQAIVQTWLRALGARSIDTLLALYAEDAVMFPAFARRAIRSDKNRRHYFEKLTPHLAESTKLPNAAIVVQQMEGGLTVASGIYSCHVHWDHEPQPCEIRFSFLLNPARPRPILHHHSSPVAQQQMI